MRFKAFLSQNGISYLPSDKNGLNRKSYKKFMYMYINTHVVNATAAQLAKYKEEHPDSKTPMADLFAEEVKRQKELGVDVDKGYDIVRYYRAARRLGWNVTRSKGLTYENGMLVCAE